MAYYHMCVCFAYSCEQVPLSSSSGKKSIFARQIAAQKAKEGRSSLHRAPEAAQTPETSMDVGQRAAADDGEEP